MTQNVKLLNINTVGPVLAVVQSEAQDAITVLNPAQLATDAEGNIVVFDYLEGVSDADETVVFMKYNIVSMSTPAASLAEVYVKALESINDTSPKVFMPEEKKIII